MIIKLIFFFVLCIVLNTLLGFVFKEEFRPLKILATTVFSAYMIFWVL